jgi:hypothetical protein
VEEIGHAVLLVKSPGGDISKRALFQNAEVYHAWQAPRALLITYM